MAAPALYALIKDGRGGDTRFLLPKELNARDVTCVDAWSADGRVMVPFKAHAEVLTLASPRFAALLGPHFKEGSSSKGEPIVLRSVSAATFEALLRWIYTGKLTTRDEAGFVEILMDLRAAADSFLMPELKAECAAALLDLMLDSSVGAGFAIGILGYSHASPHAGFLTSDPLVTEHALRALACHLHSSATTTAADIVLKVFSLLPYAVMESFLIFPWAQLLSNKQTLAVLVAWANGEALRQARESGASDAEIQDDNPNGGSSGRVKSAEDASDAGTGGGSNKRPRLESGSPSSASSQTLEADFQPHPAAGIVRQLWPLLKVANVGSADVLELLVRRRLISHSQTYDLLRALQIREACNCVTREMMAPCYALSKWARSSAYKPSPAVSLQAEDGDDTLSVRYYSGLSGPVPNHTELCIIGDEAAPRHLLLQQQRQLQLQQAAPAFLFANWAPAPTPAPPPPRPPKQLHCGLMAVQLCGINPCTITFSAPYTRDFSDTPLWAVSVDVISSSEVPEGSLPPLNPAADAASYRWALRVTCGLLINLTSDSFNSQKADGFQLPSTYHHCRGGEILQFLLEPLPLPAVPLASSGGAEKGSSSSGSGSGGSSSEPGFSFHFQSHTSAIIEPSASDLVASLLLNGVPVTGPHRLPPISMACLSISDAPPLSITASAANDDNDESSPSQKRQPRRHGMTAFNVLYGAACMRAA